MILRTVLALLMGLLLTSSSCFKSKSSQKTLWIYTSIYKNVISDLEPLLKAKFPNVKFEWYQSGSENVAARINAEISAGKTQADLVMTSDPLWYAELKKAGQLLQYDSPQNKKVPETLRDPENYFVAVRMPVAVIAYNNQVIKQPPKSWKDLTNPAWKGKLSMGSPMESGTFMLVTSQLVKKEGWEYFSSLRKNELLSAGGNSAVITRLETKERPVGIVLLENILEAKKKGSPIDAVYPTEGAILIPSPIAILSKTANPDLSKQVYDYFLSDEMQIGILKGRMYSPVLLTAAPVGAKSFQEVFSGALPWTPQILEALFTEKEAVKKTFIEKVLN